MPLWVPIVQCWTATGAAPWSARYGLLDAPGGALWLSRWRVLSDKLAKADAKQLQRLLLARGSAKSHMTGSFD